MIVHTKLINTWNGTGGRIDKAFLISHLQDGRYFYWNIEKDHNKLVCGFNVKIPQDIPEAYAIACYIGRQITFFGDGMRICGEYVHCVPLKVSEHRIQRDYIMSHQDAAYLYTMAINRIQGV